MKFSKVEVGEEYYFDILGKTDKNETYTVTIIEKRLFPKKKIIVKSNQTNDVFNCYSKYLVPIHNSDISNYNCLVRSDNNIINIDEVDYEILKTIKSILSNYEDEDINKVEEGLNLLLIKMSMIVKNNNSCDILKNLKHKKFNISTNLLNNIMKDSDKFDSSENDEYVIPESVDKKFKVFTRELIEHINSNDKSFDVYEYFKNFPDEMLLLKKLTNNKKQTEKIDHDDIKNISDQIYSLISDPNKVVFIPYYFFGNKSVLVFDSITMPYDIDYISGKFESILKESDYTVNYAMQIICLEKHNNNINDGEENDYE